MSRLLTNHAGHAGQGVTNFVTSVKSVSSAS
jgi:hypothetical protein